MKLVTIALAISKSMYVTGVILRSLRKVVTKWSVLYQIFFLFCFIALSMVIC